jgi:hypothetical protein
LSERFTGNGLNFINGCWEGTDLRVALLHEQHTAVQRPDLGRLQRSCQPRALYAIWQSNRWKQAECLAAAHLHVPLRSTPSEHAIFTFNKDHGKLAAYVTASHAHVMALEFSSVIHINKPNEGQKRGHVMTQRVRAYTYLCHNLALVGTQCREKRRRGRFHRKEHLPYIIQLPPDRMRPFKYMWKMTFSLPDWFTEHTNEWRFFWENWWMNICCSKLID